MSLQQAAYADCAHRELITTFQIKSLLCAAFPTKMTKLCAAQFIELRLFLTDGEADLLPEKLTITLTEKMNSTFYWNYFFCTQNPERTTQLN